MSIVSNNIKYLRRQIGLTQEQFAQKLDIKRSLLGAYEEARANPNLDNLKNMATEFGISVDQLIKHDFKKSREATDLSSIPMNASRPMTVSHSGVVPAQGKLNSEPSVSTKSIEKSPEIKHEFRSIAEKTKSEPLLTAGAGQLPLFNNQFRPQNPPTAQDGNYPTIHWLSKNQYGEYLTNHQNPSYLAQLPVFQLPNLPQGYYRAFESGNDFMFPGALLVGEFVRNWYDIREGVHYNFVLRSQGIVARKVKSLDRQHGILTLVSDVAAIAAFRVHLQEILEVWEIKAFVSTQMPAPQPSLTRIGQLVDEIYSEINQGL